MVSRKGHSASHLAFINLVVLGCRVTASRYIEHAVKSTQSGGARSPEVNTEIRKDSSHNLFADTFHLTKCPHDGNSLRFEQNQESSFSRPDL